MGVDGCGCVGVGVGVSEELSLSVLISSFLTLRVGTVAVTIHSTPSTRPMPATVAPPRLMSSCEINKNMKIWRDEEGNKEGE